MERVIWAAWSCANAAPIPDSAFLGSLVWAWWTSGYPYVVGCGRRADFGMSLCGRGVMDC